MVLAVAIARATCNSSYAIAAVVFVFTKDSTAMELGVRMPGS